MATAFAIAIFKPCVVNSDVVPPYPHIKKPIANAIGFCGAAYEARTRYLHLGKVALYQMS